MKNVLIIILLFILSSPCFAALTENDIRRIIREEIEPVKKDTESIKLEIATMKGEIKGLKGEMRGLEGKMATKDDIIAVKTDITNMYQKLGDKIDILYGIIIASFVTLIVVIAVPQILIAYRERRESRLSKEVDELKQEIAELKKRIIITP